jgi:hypothetical protein
MINSSDPREVAELQDLALFAWMLRFRMAPVGVFCASGQRRMIGSAWISGLELEDQSMAFQARAEMAHCDRSRALSRGAGVDALG